MVFEMSDDEEARIIEEEPAADELEPTPTRLTPDVNNPIGGVGRLDEHHDEVVCRKCGESKLFVNSETLICGTCEDEIEMERERDVKRAAAEWECMKSTAKKDRAEEKISNLSPRAFHYAR